MFVAFGAWIAVCFFVDSCIKYLFDQKNDLQGPLLRLRRPLVTLSLVPTSSSSWMMALRARRLSLPVLLQIIRCGTFCFFAHSVGFHEGHAVVSPASSHRRTDASPPHSVAAASRSSLLSLPGPQPPPVLSHCLHFLLPPAPIEPTPLLR